MLARRIIPCLDVKDGQVVKGVRFRDHEVVGDVLDLAQRYSDEGADELVFYDITASADQRRVTRAWVEATARRLTIPFCVAGGIRSLEDARDCLNNGADKISINSPALERPELIDELSAHFGAQCVVIGIDSFEQDGDYVVHQYTGDPDKSRATRRNTMDWIAEVSARGAGEIVLNCMNQDGVRKGYDLKQLEMARAVTKLPLIASGGAGTSQDFADVFQQANVDGALAASVFHKNLIQIADLKAFLIEQGLPIRP